MFICDECVELCMDIIREEHKTALSKGHDGVPTPADINAVLDEYVIGQARAKRMLAVAVHNHYKRWLMLAKLAMWKSPVKHPACRPNRLRQDAARADTCADA